MFLWLVARPGAEVVWSGVDVAVSPPPAVVAVRLLTTELLGVVSMELEERRAGTRGVDWAVGSCSA